MSDYKAREFEIVRSTSNPNEKAIVVYEGMYLEEYLVVEPEFAIRSADTFMWEPTDPPSYAAPNPDISLSPGSYLISHNGRAKTGDFDGEYWHFDYRHQGEKVIHSDEIKVVCPSLPKNGWYGDGPRWKSVKRALY